MSEGENKELPSLPANFDLHAHCDAKLDAAERRVQELEAVILDIDSHATAVNASDADAEWAETCYLVTIGSLHRALGVIGHSAVKSSAAPVIHPCSHGGGYVKVFDGQFWHSLCPVCYHDGSGGQDSIRYRAALEEIEQQPLTRSVRAAVRIAAEALRSAEQGGAP
jgi:hypothetical protein